MAIRHQGVWLILPNLEEHRQCLKCILNGNIIHKHFLTILMNQSINCSIKKCLFIHNSITYQTKSQFSACKRLTKHYNFSKENWNKCFLKSPQQLGCQILWSCVNAIPKILVTWTYTQWTR